MLYEKISYTCLKKSIFRAKRRFCTQRKNSQYLSRNIISFPNGKNYWKNNFSNKENLDCMSLSCHIRVSEWIHTCLNVKELLARSKREIWRLSDCNWTRTYNHLVRKRTLNHLTKLAKWLSCVESTSLYGAFDCMFLSCHVRVSEWIHTL